MSRRSSTCAVVVAIATMLLADAAVAAEPVRLVYRAPATCPDEAAFIAAVRARTAEALFVTGAETTSRTFTVSVDAVDPVNAIGAGFKGTLEVTDRQAQTAQRHFEAADCGQVASALALLTALTIDPNASMAEPPAPPAVARVIPISEPAPAPLPVRADRPRWEFAAGVGVSLASGLFPAVAVGPALVGEVAREPRGVWAPAIRVGLLYAQTGFLGPSSSEAQYRWGAVRVEGCPVRAAFATLEVRPCARVDTGFLWADGTESAIAVPTPATKGWLAAGAGARARWFPVRRFFVELEAGALLPITRPTFVFTGPAAVVHRTPPALATGGLGVGVSFL
jgi:hypothetical protein